MQKSLLFLLVIATTVFSTVTAAEQRQNQQTLNQERLVQSIHLWRAGNGLSAVATTVADSNIDSTREYGTLSGKIVGVETDSGFTHADVFAWEIDAAGNQVMVSNAEVFDDLSFKFHELPPGVYVILADVAGYTPTFYGDTYDRNEAKEIALQPGDNISNIDINMQAVEPGTASISGTVLDIETDQPIKNARVHALSIDNPFWGVSTEADSVTGEFILSGLHAGKYLIEAFSKNYLPGYFPDAVQWDNADTIHVQDDQQLEGFDIRLTKGSSIAGKVTAPDGNPLSRIEVYASSSIYGMGTMLVQKSFTDVSGEYEIGGLREGAYYVYAIDHTAGYPRAIFWENATSYADADQVEVGFSEAVEGIDFTIDSLANNGLVEGFVYDELGEPLKNANVFIESVYPAEKDSFELDILFPHFHYHMSTRTDSTGWFQFDSVPEGNFYVYASYSQNHRYVQRWWKDAGSRSDATPIHIDGSGATIELTFNLPVKQFKSSISGIVKDETGQLLRNARLSLSPTEISRCDETGVRCGENFYGYANTDSSGFFKIDKIPAGEYYLQAQYWDGEKYGMVWYENSETQASATPLVVGADDQITNIELTMSVRPIYGKISGVLTNEETGEIITRAHVEVTPLHGVRLDFAPYIWWNQSTTVDSSGRYTFSWMPEGKYVVSAYADGAFEYFQDVVVAELADTIDVVGGQTAIVDIGLARRDDGDGVIEGRVVSELPDFPLGVGVVIAKPAVTIEMWPVSEAFYNTVTNPDGSYQLTGLPDGEYLVSAFAQNFIAEYYPDSYDPSQAQHVFIENGNVVSAIDFSLHPAIYCTFDDALTPGERDGSEIHGVVTDESGKALGNAYVFLLDDSSNVVAVARTNTNGEYVLNGLPGGNYRLQASHEGNESRYNNAANNAEQAPKIQLTGGVAEVDFALPATTTGVINEPIDVPEGLSLMGNYPNPFNPETKIVFSIGEEAQVQVSVFNLLGQRVNTLLNTRLEQGQHAITWNGRDTHGRALTSGLYFYRIQANKAVKTGKMILSK